MLIDIGKEKYGVDLRKILEPKAPQYRDGEVERIVWCKQTGMVLVCGSTRPSGL